MADMKATITFDAPNYESGWSETYYTQATGGYGAIMNYFMNTWMPLRVALLLNEFKATFVRVSTAGAPRDSYVNAVTPANGVGTLDHTTYPYAGIGDCLLLRLDSTTSYGFFNHRFIQGVPGAIFTGRDYLGAAAPGGFDAALQAFITSLLSTDAKIGLVSRVGGFHLTACNTISILGRTNRKLGRPLRLLVGRRAVA